jgi:dihydroxy-acid dehydratase
MELNKYSKTVTQDESQPASQAMLYGIGLTDEDMKKPLVGIASTWYEGNTCNMHLNGLSKYVKDGVYANGLVGLQYHWYKRWDYQRNRRDALLASFT